METQRTLTARPHRSRHVLVVEDDDLVASVALDMLEFLGYEVQRVPDADAALQALAQDQPVDIVFSDVSMPGALDGVALAREIRRRRPNLPVVLTSGYPDIASRQAAASQIRIIPKPYHMEQLREVLSAASPNSSKGD